MNLGELGEGCTKTVEDLVLGLAHEIGNVPEVRVEGTASDAGTLGSRR